MAAVFDTLFSINVNDKTEKKPSGGVELTYLSWPFAWAEVKRRYPDAHYEIVKFGGIPYICDPQTGYMVFTNVTIDGVTHEMWLPVMDGANNAMKTEPYTVKTKYKEVTVRAATMMDINKAIMRCLVKNLAMFGMGLYIYAGEDLPVPETEQIQEQRADLVAKIRAEMEKKGYKWSKKCADQLDAMNQEGLTAYYESLLKMPDKAQKEQQKEKTS